MPIMILLKTSSFAFLFIVPMIRTVHEHSRLSINVHKYHLDFLFFDLFMFNWRIIAL